MNLIKRKVDSIFVGKAETPNPQKTILNRNYTSRNDLHQKPCIENKIRDEHSPTAKCITPQTKTNYVTNKTRTIPMKQNSLTIHTSPQNRPTPEMPRSPLHSNFQQNKIQIQAFIQTEQEKHQQISSMISQNITEQDKQINRRLEQRFLKSRFQKSRPQTPESSNSSEDEGSQRVRLFFEKEKTEKIMRVVQHFNNQINIIRKGPQGEDAITKMEEIERQKWQRIQAIEKEYEKLMEP